eukprot:GEZU01005345.1.p1 GENE.GEZU01005345.1~~GEZU01005345.1.p1  ORF type:complete len:267 (-),score=68.37 GEZU01005345.1:162-929(-)
MWRRSVISSSRLALRAAITETKTSTSTKTLPIPSGIPEPGARSSAQVGGPLHVAKGILVANKPKEEKVPEIPLEWRRADLPNGTTLFTHPSFEEVMSVKQARAAQERLLRRITVSLPKQTQGYEMYNSGMKRSKPFLPYNEMRQKPVTAAKEEKLRKLNSRLIQTAPAPLTPQQIQAKQKNLPALTPEQIAEVRRLRAEDPFVHTTQALAKQFKVPAHVIEEAAPTPANKILADKRITREITRARKKNKRIIKGY